MKILMARYVLVFALSLLADGELWGYSIQLAGSGSRSFKGQLYPGLNATWVESPAGSPPCTECINDFNWTDTQTIFTNPVFWDKKGHSSPVVTFVVGSPTSDVSSSAIGTAVQNAVAAWDALDNSNNQLTVSYGGFIYPGVQNVKDDGFNTIFWTTSSDFNGGTATTLIWYSDDPSAPGDKGEILDVDIAMNDAAPWSASVMQCGGTTTSKDIQSVVTHELGHALGLAHTGDAATPCSNMPTMESGGNACGSCEFEVERELTLRTLAVDDSDGYLELYGAAGPPGGSVMQIEGNGSTSPVGPALKVSAASRPVSPALLLNYPNPFNPETAIQFELRAPAEVSLIVYNLVGQAVEELISSQPYGAGRHTVVWQARARDGRALASGVYILRLEAGGVSLSRKLTLLR